MVEALLKHALENTETFPSFRTTWDVFEFLEKNRLDRKLIHQNHQEIEEIWRNLSSSVPLTPSSGPFDVQPQDADVDNTHSDDQSVDNLEVPIFDEDSEPTAVSIFLPQTARYSHANTKLCEGADSYINIKTVLQNSLIEDVDGTVIVHWKHQKYQRTDDQTARQTRCIVLRGQKADAMMVDILFGTDHEKGVIHPQSKPIEPKNVSMPPHVPNMAADNPTSTTFVPISMFSVSLSVPLSSVSGILSDVGISRGSMPNYTIGNNPFGAGPIAGLGGNDIATTSNFGPANHTNVIASTTHSSTAVTSSSDSTSCQLQDLAPNRRGKRKAEDEPRARTEAKRPQPGNGSHSS
ncbi:hypothetical protein F5Y04DRAFT_282239 [Hypomontagnella monticulosa]|nr:hypothetical protein F5Y04DRAFT_282239 [Hypomontagnella monticulosa]